MLINLEPQNNFIIVFLVKLGFLRDGDRELVKIYNSPKRMRLATCGIIPLKRILRYFQHV